MSMEERLNKVEQQQSADREKFNTLYAANQAICEQLSTTNNRLSEVTTQLAVLVVTPHKELLAIELQKDLEPRITALEMERAKQQGGLQVGKYMLGAGLTIFGWLIAHLSGWISTIAQHKP